VVGGFNYYDLEEILGYTLGVAITGSEEIETSLIVTEGYGNIKMSKRTFDLLSDYNKKFASINGATQIRAGVIRPEIVIPLKEKNLKKDPLSSTSQGIQKGSLVRVIRAPHFGSMGKVVELPPELQKMESETMVRVAIIKIDNEKLIIPRSNLEMVEID
jgi:transcription antitermination factor NusG